ncbi:MAG TPA: protein kinase [Pirellulales bacterium]|nr:protein kinase [Pirellulales bacterium]
MDFQGRPPFEAASRWEGEQLGQFVLQKFIGGGGMGIVFRALDTTLDREVAVKVLSGDQSADEETLRRFRNEAQSAARLSHDNIAHVFFVGEDRGVHYIVFEFIEGVNIRDLVERQGPLSLHEAISYTYQVAQALEHASQRAVIHRDIKPSNVLVTPDGKAKLVDMGLARLHQIAPAEGELTASGVTLGTFDYISPEQARDPRSADVRSDMYSLGCSLFFMLTGRPPFPDGTVLQKLLQHQGDEPPDPRQYRPELPAEISHILSRLLAKNPAQRYQQPSELIDELAALGEAQGLPIGSTRVAWATPQRRGLAAGWQRHLPWIVPVAALLLIVLALDFYWSPRGNQTAEALPVVNMPRPAPQQLPEAPALPRQTPPAADKILDEPLRPAPAGPGDAGPPSSEQARRPATSDPPVAPFSQPRSGFLSKLVENLGEFSTRAKQAAARPTRPGDSHVDGPGTSTTGAGDEARASDVAADTAARGDRTLFVSDQPGPGAFSSLHAACSEAKDGDTIELRYDGNRASERPIEISNKRLTIRPGEGFRPIVLFQPQPEANPFKDPPAMFSVSGGELTAGDIEWQFVLPANVPPHWALFETRGCELLAFRHCTFTVEGPVAYQSRVAFFDIKAPPGGNSMNMGGDTLQVPAVNIRLQDCIARGEASFLRDDDLQSVRLDWDNGLLAVSDRLFVAGGNSLQPRHDVRAELTLRHVTAMVASGLALLTNSVEAPYQPMTQIRCDDCIIAAKNRAPLVEQRGSDRIDQYQTRFQWSGDHNFFDGFDVFWQIMNASGQSGSKQLDFEQWCQLWQGSSRAQIAGPDAVVWTGLPGDDRPFHTHIPSDYTLDDDLAASIAADGTTVSRDAGVRAFDLPAVRNRPVEADFDKGSSGK